MICLIQIYFFHWDLLVFFIIVWKKTGVYIHMNHWRLNKMTDILQTTFFGIFLNESQRILIQMSLKSDPMGPLDNKSALHDDVIKWKHTPRYWPFVREIHRSPVNSAHTGQWRGALMFSLNCALTKRLSKQSWGWWFETPSRSLWRNYNGFR